MRVALIFVALVELGLCLAAPAHAQEAPARYPADGLAILDCDPAAPAPEDSCALRIPPRYGYEAPQSDALGDGDVEFRLLRPGREGFPDDLTLSATLLLVDLSPGPNGGRRGTFDLEKRLLARFVAGLPRSEQVAIYGFNERLRLIADFTTDQDALVAAIDGLDLEGTNTRIATFVGDSVSVLADRDDVLLKNIVLVSDGQEEGRAPTAGVTEDAIAAGVSISAIGSFWRPVGSAQTGQGMDYLRELTEGTLGTVAQVLLRRADEAGASVDDFVSQYGDALRNSALIVPRGTPRAARISMGLREPVIGSDRVETTQISVTFTPASAAAAETDGDAATADPGEPAQAPSTIFGIPSLWAVIAAGVIVALIVLALIASFVRRSRHEADDVIETGDAGPGPQTAPPPPAPAGPRPVAFLVFADGRAKAPIGGQRVSIGRSASNDIVIDDDSISRLHAQVHRNRDGGFSVTDMDSLNGTRINNETVKGTGVVRLGDAVTFGKIETKLISA